MRFLISSFLFFHVVAFADGRALKIHNVSTFHELNDQTLPEVFDTPGTSEVAEFYGKAVVFQLPNQKPEVHFFSVKNSAVHHGDVLNAAAQGSPPRFREEYPAIFMISQGYQLGATYEDGIWKVTRIDIDSGITWRQTELRLELSRELQERLLQALIEGIQPHLIGFRKPKFPKRMRFSCGELVPQ